MDPATTEAVGGEGIAPRVASTGYLLLVEDEPDLAATVAEYLDGEGYAVLTARDGVAALRHLSRRVLPGLVVTDFMMPGISGAELLTIIRADPRLADLPVLVVSAVPELAAAAGVPANELVNKPMELSDLLVLVARHCQRSPRDRPR
jgi:CheY-like chemotaxis protein